MRNAGVWLNARLQFDALVGGGTDWLQFVAVAPLTTAGLEGRGLSTKVRSS